MSVETTVTGLRILASA